MLLRTPVQKEDGANDVNHRSEIATKTNNSKTINLQSSNRPKLEDLVLIDMDHELLDDVFDYHSSTIRDA